jgi:hypothetical protein
MMTPTVWHRHVSSVFRDDGIRKERASAKRGTRKWLSTVAPEIQLGVPLGDHRAHVADRRQPFRLGRLSAE